MFEHQEAHPAPPGGGTPTHSLSRHAQPMLNTINGRREPPRRCTTSGTVPFFSCDRVQRAHRTSVVDLEAVCRRRNFKMYSSHSHNRAVCRFDAQSSQSASHRLSSLSLSPGENRFYRRNLVTEIMHAAVDQRLKASLPCENLQNVDRE